MSISDIFRINELKTNLAQIQEERDSLKKELARYQQVRKERDASKTKYLRELNKLCDEIVQITKERDALRKGLQQVKKERDAYRKLLPETDLYRQLKKEISLLNERSKELSKEISKKKGELIVLEDSILLQSFGFYTPKYDFENSQIYRLKLEHIRNQQSAMVKSQKAAYCCTQSVTLNYSVKEGERMIKDYVKLLLRSFNNECDASILKVTFSNVNSIEKKITKAFEILNNLGQRMSIVISADYLNLKLSELYLCYEYQIKKQEEKEERRRIRIQMREEAKVQKEIEEIKAKIEKEEKHFNRAMSSTNELLQKAKTDAERELIRNELTNIQEKLATLEKDKLDIQYREQNTRAGYVYIISNIGSFGENVYKIGVTRRLDPQERVDELGDASVPFYYDVHAMIFSDDAPSLENALHKTFGHRRLNRINLRREFFHAKLEEIEDVVRRNFNKPVEFTRLARAEQYRQSLMLKNNETIVALQSK